VSARRAATAFACLGILLAGCAGGPAPTHHYYRLELAEPTATLEQPALEGVLVVDRLRAEAIASGRELLERSADSPELRRRSHHHWVEPPPTMLQVRIVGYLRVAGVASHVVTPDLHLSTDYELAGRILAFERVLGSGAPRVRIALELSLTRVEGRELLLLETYVDEREAGGGGVDDAAVAFAEALSSILDRLVAELSAQRSRG
jgi:ABC-type uncharacterized transport system auxiliary subunit